MPTMPTMPTIPGARPTEAGTNVHILSPMAPLSISMPIHPDSPPRDREPREDKHDGFSRYGQPPPYGPSYYPYYHPYGPPPTQGYYQSPPPIQGPSYGGYGPPPYYSHGGYSYPSQHPNQTPLPDSKRRKSPSRRLEKDQKTAIPVTVAVDIETERIRAAVEPVKVKPMRSDFHFFVDDIRDKIQADAEQELGEHASDKMLLFTNMNARLTKAWEDASDETRAQYLVKEEEDRQRFMTEDEITSRHCATLTARARSPRGKDGEGNGGEHDEESGDETEDNSESEDCRKNSPKGESPTKKLKFENPGEREGE